MGNVCVQSKFHAGSVLVKEKLEISYGHDSPFFFKTRMLIFFFLITTMMTHKNWKQTETELLTETFNKQIVIDVLSLS